MSSNNIEYMSGDMITMILDLMEYDNPKLNPKIFVHGCNCHVAMGSGIAGGISKYIPEAAKADKAYNKRYHVDFKEEMLGGYSYIEFGENNRHKLINLYTQFFPGKDLRMDALKDGFDNLAFDYGSNGYELVFPKIGAGIAGGDWDEISKVIERSCGNEFENMTCVVWDKG